jgi:signal peptidase II
MVFLAIVTVVSLALDLGTKWWALRTLTKTVPPDQTEATPIEVTSWLTFLLARNRGGAWGLLQNANETLRRPFFLIISAAAIVFVVYLYRKVHPRQHALRWGLPLVLGGAIGNLVDRVRYGWVIDFIDYRAAWVRLLNEQIARISPSHAVTDHWPTFNVADISICIGVGLMAVDIFTSRRIARNSQADAAAVPVSHELVDTSGESAAGDADAEVKADGTSSPRGGHA